MKVAVEIGVYTLKGRLAFPTIVGKECALQTMVGNRGGVQGPGRYQRFRLIGRLPKQGYSALSRFGSKPEPMVPLRQRKAGQLLTFSFKNDVAIYLQQDRFGRHQSKAVGTVARNIKNAVPLGDKIGCGRTVCGPEGIDGEGPA